MSSSESDSPGSADCEMSASDSDSPGSEGCKMSASDSDSPGSGYDYEDMMGYEKQKGYVRSYGFQIDKYLSDITEKGELFDEGTEDVHTGPSTCTTLLCQAIKKYENGTALALLKKYPEISPGEKDPSKDLPLHVAVIAGNYRLVRRLLKGGARVDSTFVEKKQPLHLICDKNYTGNIGTNEQIVELLIKHGADIHAVEGKNGDTPLHLALKHGHRDLVRCLVRLGGVNKHVNKQGRYVLHEAFNSTAHDYELIQKMITEGFDLNLEDQYKLSVYKCAARFCTPDIKENVTYVCDFRSEAMKKIELLLQNGASINTIIDKDDNTLLLASCKTKCNLNLEFFLKYGADVKIKNKHGETPLLLCAKNHPLECVKSLIEHGADINATTEDGKTVIHFAAQNKDQQVLEFFLTSGLDDETDNNEKSALYYAVYSGQLANVQLFLNRQCNEYDDMTDLINNESLIHTAVKQLDENITHLLLSCLLFIGYVDENKNTVFQILSNKLNEYDPNDEYKSHRSFGYNSYYDSEDGNDDEEDYEEYAEKRAKLEEANESAERIRDMITLHTAVSATRYSYTVNKRDIELLLSMNRSMYQHCLEEINVMKKEKLTEKISLFDIFEKCTHDVSTLIKTETVKDKFCSLIDSKKFPNYHKQLNHILNSAVVRNNVSDVVKQTFNRMSNVQFTDKIFDYLFNFLTTLDLKHLASIYPDTNEFAIKEMGKLEFPLIY